MKNVKWLLIACSIMSLIAGCSPDVTEISDIALVMATGIDYDKEDDQYIITLNCVLPTTTSMEKAGKQSEWVASATGNSIMEATKNLRSRAGKTLIWQHNKFFIVGEGAARHSFFDIVDFLTRSRQIRITSYLIVSEGKAADKLKVKSETGDLVTNELLGKIRNEKEWGKSINLQIKDIANWNQSPYRGFVTGRLSTAVSQSNSNKVLFLKGGSAFNKGKFIDWLDGDDALVVHLLSKKSQWKNLEFTEVIQTKSLKLSALFHVSKTTIHSSYAHGSPQMNIAVNLNATMSDMQHALNLTSRETIMQLEKAASEYMEKKIRDRLNHFQRGLKADLLGFSDYFIQYHPKSWNKLKNEWENVYPTIPIQIKVVVKMEKLGMSQSKGDN